jgi:phosphatidylglycerol phospholipase C
MMYKIMVGPFGNSFLNDAKKAGRAVFYWTVNDEEWMKWCIGKGINGVITDDPKKYLEVCENYQGEKLRLPFKSWGGLIWMNILAAVFSLLFRYRYGFKIDAAKIRKSLQGNGAIVQA